MQLAQLAAQMHRDDDRWDNPHQILQKAWAIFLHSSHFCSQLQQMSAQDVRHLFASTPEISHLSSVAKQIQEVEPPKPVLRFYPHRPEGDDVRQFLGVKQARSVIEKIERYCNAHQEEGGGSNYDRFLEAASRKGKGRNHCCEIPVDLLEQIKKHKTQVKVRGGKKPYELPLSGPLLGNR